MIWTYPNILTVARIVAAPVIALVFVILDRPLADSVALVIFILAAITDFLDGWIARRFDQVSELGKMLDPIGDKVMVLVGLLVVLGNMHGSGLFGETLVGLMVVLAALIVLREVVISGVREYLGAIKLPVTMIAKWKTTVQLLAVGAGLLALRVDHEVHEVLERDMALGGQELVAFKPTDAFLFSIYTPVMLLTLGLLLLATLLTLISGWGYMRRALNHLRTPEVFR